jgi:hypothetical protein
VTGHATPDRAANPTPIQTAALLRLCKADPRWDDTAQEIGSIAHGYVAAVREALDVAATIAIEKATRS